MILEQFTQSKYRSGFPNEDAIFCGKTLVGVFDGVTSKSEKVIQGMTPGEFASVTAVGLLKTFDENLFDPIKYFSELTIILSNYVDLFDDLKDLPRVSCLIYDAVGKKVVSYGDCQFSLNGSVLTSSKEIDNILSYIRSTFYKEYLEDIPFKERELMDEDWGRKIILPILKEQYRLENSSSELGYPIINGISFEERMMQIWEVDIGDMLILASDGYPAVLSTLEESERYLFSYLKKDPLMIGEHLSTKGVGFQQVSYDDRTYCRIFVES